MEKMVARTGRENRTARGQAAGRDRRQLRNTS